MEALLVIAVVVLVGMAVLSRLSRSSRPAPGINCSNNLKQVGVAFRTWSLDHHDLYPMAMSTNTGGTRELRAEAFRHFQIISNELSTPAVVQCPKDSRKPAHDFDHDFSNANVSYFVGLNAPMDQPQWFLSGDRNITGTLTAQNALLTVPPNAEVGWTPELHKTLGHVLFADGSVRQFETPPLRMFLRKTGITNVLAMP
jgi:prepilin-type processing-associated H-X9-DG protein